MKKFVGGEGEPPISTRCSWWKNRFFEGRGVKIENMFEPRDPSISLWQPNKQCKRNSRLSWFGWWMILTQPSQFLLESKRKIPCYISPKDSSPPTNQTSIFPVPHYLIYRSSPNKKTLGVNCMCTKTTLKKLRKPNNERKNIGRISASPIDFLGCKNRDGNL